MNQFDKLDVSKNYQLNVRVVEARQLSVVNADTLAIIRVGTYKKTVRAKTSKTQQPYFNEIVSFPFCEPLSLLLKRCLRVGIHQIRCKKLIGQCDIELTTIWGQMGHQFYHKWLELVDPQDPTLTIKGYLKCDIALLQEGIQPTIPYSSRADDIDGNLLAPNRRQNAVISINLYRADGIRCRRVQRGRQTLVRCNNLQVSVKFAGRTQNSQVCKDHEEPVWNEMLSFVEPIPSLFQTIVIELRDHKLKMVVGSAEICLSELCGHAGMGGTSMPSFGPAFLYVYQHKNKSTMTWLSGRILLSLSCHVLDRANTGMRLKTTQIVPVDEKIFGPYETFVLFLALFQCTFFGKKSCRKCQLSVNHGTKFAPQGIQQENELTGHDSLMVWVPPPGNLNVICDCYNAWTCQTAAPVLKTACFWPAMDYREKRSNAIKNRMRDVSEKCDRYCQSALRINQPRRKVLDLVNTMLDKCSGIIALAPNRHENKLDKAKRIEMNEACQRAKTEIEKLALENTRPTRDILSIIRHHVSKITHLAEQPQHTFPDFEIAVTSMNKKIASARLPIDDYLYSRNPEERGKYCGKVRTISVENARGAEVAAVDVCIWFAREREISKCLGKLTGKREALQAFDRGIKLEERHTFELRAHVYNGRINPGFDESGLADPLVRIITCSRSHETQVRFNTLDPVWDEIIILHDIDIYGTALEIKAQSVGVIVEVMDYDGHDRAELVGRGAARPVVTLLTEQYTPTRLFKLPVRMYQQETAELLITLELIEVEPDPEGGRRGQTRITPLPEQIRPHLKEYFLDAVFWGVRSYNRRCCWPTPRLMGLIECNGVRLESSTATAAASFNFEYQKKRAQILIPEEQEYTPPITVALYEFKPYKKASYIGGAIIPYASQFFRKSGFQMDEPNVFIEVDLPRIEESPNTMVELDEKPDWWSKLYSSKFLNISRRSIKIYQQELENQPEFEYFQDFLREFEIKTGSLNNQHTIGIMKCNMHISPAASESNETLSKADEHLRPDPLDVTVRAYIVSASNLTPTDLNGRCDPYIAISLGKTSIIDRKNYIYKDTQPIFGKCFELKGTLPEDHLLRIRVMDHDLCMTDNLIGETFIDVENRLYSKHRATCGIPDTFEMSGHCAWRDQEEPFQILRQVCLLNGIPAPLYKGSGVFIGKYIISREPGESYESLGLRILRNFHMIPDYGFELVPEHIEVRHLYHPKKPRIDQGKLEMWVDVFQGHGSLPPQVQITPRKAEKLELRVVVWSTAEVLPSDINVITGEESTDIYVKGWLTSSNESQRTDTHYHSLTGEGSFNWRFIFPFLYSPSDRKMIVTKKEGNDKIPPRLELQVWDNDLLVDDFVGSLTLDLNNMPKGTQSAKTCSLAIMQNEKARISLFKHKKTRGWWPFRARRNDIIAGKVDMELEIINEDGAALSPVGFGREEPQALPEPSRPATYYFWNINPLSIIKSLAFGNLGRRLLYLAGIGLLIIFILAGFIALPQLLLKKWLHA